jgi:hypothetical protein
MTPPLNLLIHAFARPTLAAQSRRLWHPIHLTRSIIERLGDRWARGHPLRY